MMRSRSQGKVTDRHLIDLMANINIKKKSVNRSHSIT